MHLFLKLHASNHQYDEDKPLVMADIAIENDNL
jgi:hypothetical protein